MPSFCHECGSALEIRCKFCPECGTPVTTHEEPAHRSLLSQFFTPIRPTTPVDGAKQQTRSIAGALATLGLLVMLLAIWGGLNSEPPASAPIIKGAKYNEAPHSRAPIIKGPTYSEATQSNAANSQDIPTAETPAKIGDTFAIGYWAYTVHGATWQTAVPSAGYSAEFPDAAFLIVDLSACNEDRTASTLPRFKLVDNQGREYDESSKGVYLQGAFETLKTMNPGVYSRGNVLFDVPHRSDYRLKVSGGLESEKFRLVDLTQALRVGSDGGVSNGPQ
jgi:hypothetical protein